MSLLRLLLHTFPSSEFFDEMSASERYSPACTRLIAQYKTMLKLVGDSVPSIEEFMTRYRVRLSLPLIDFWIVAEPGVLEDGSPCSIA